MDVDIPHADLEQVLDDLINQVKISKKQKESLVKSQRMSTKVLADSTVRKALDIIRKNGVSKINNHKFLVQGSDSQYDVFSHSKQDLICLKSGEKILCNGWKYKKNCKHCEAVRIFSKNNSNTISS